MKRQTPAPQRAGTKTAAMREEWVRLMREIAALDREEYRRLRAEAWEAVARSHRRKVPAEITAWTARAS